MVWASRAAGVDLNGWRFPYCRPVISEDGNHLTGDAISPQMDQVVLRNRVTTGEDACLPSQPQTAGFRSILMPPGMGRDVPPLRFPVPLRIQIETKRGTERSEIDLSEAKAPQGDRRRAGSTAEVAEIDAERKSCNRGFRQ